MKLRVEDLLKFNMAAFNGDTLLQPAELDDEFSGIESDTEHEDTSRCPVRSKGQHKVSDLSGPIYSTPNC